MNQRALKRGDIIDVDIDNIAFGGAGVGRHILNDRAFTIFVDNTAPGDRVRVRVGSRKKTYAIGYIEEFISKSPDRIEPMCKHFGLDGDRCGGCSMQFFSYEKQLEVKEQHVRDAVGRIGGFDEGIVKPIIGCDNPWYYRNKMDISFSRTKDCELMSGLHIKRMHHDLVPLTECYLMNESLGKFVEELREFFIAFEKRNGRLEGLQSVIIREGKNTGEMMIIFQTENFVNDNAVEDFLLRVLDFARDDKIFCPRLKSVYFSNIINKKGQAKRVDEKLIWGASTIKEELKIEGLPNSLKFDISPQAFFQPNSLQAEKLFGLVVKAAALTGKETVYDLYCGAGTIALSVAGDAKKVYGIELNGSAIENAKLNAQTNGILNATFLEGDVLKKMPELDGIPDVVIVDPPRNGLQTGVVDKISELKPKRIVYVSCNPTTLARDLQLFKKTGYNTLSVQPVDMFPQTYHIENVAVIVR